MVNPNLNNPSSSIQSHNLYTSCFLQIEHLTTTAMHAFKTLLIAVAMVATSVSAEKQKCTVGASTSTGFGSYSSSTWLHNEKGDKIGGNDDLKCSPGKNGNTIKGKGLDHEVKLDVDCDNGYIRSVSNI